MYSNKRNRFLVSTISDSPKNYFTNLEIFEKWGLDGIHFDIMDGSFVPRIGLFPELLKAISDVTSLPIEVHIMMDRPLRFLESLVENGAHRLILHYEGIEFSEQSISFVKELGVEVGVAINPSTPVDAIQTMLPELHSVLLMAINPGIPKHPLLPKSINRLKQLSLLRDLKSPAVEIGIDGGVTFQNISELISNGADYLICGSGTVFDPTGDIESNIKKLLATLD